MFSSCHVDSFQISTDQYNSIMLRFHWDIRPLRVLLSLIHVSWRPRPLTHLRNFRQDNPSSTLVSLIQPYNRPLRCLPLARLRHFWITSILHTVTSTSTSNPPHFLQAPWTNVSFQRKSMNHNLTRSKSSYIPAWSGETPPIPSWTGINAHNYIAT